MEGEANIDFLLWLCKLTLGATFHGLLAWCQDFCKGKRGEMERAREVFAETNKFGKLDMQKI